MILSDDGNYPAWLTAVQVGHHHCCYCGCDSMRFTANTVVHRLNFVSDLHVTGDYVYLLGNAFSLRGIGAFDLKCLAFSPHALDTNSPVSC